MSDSGVDPLLTRLASGDKEAFETVYRRYSARLYGAALRMVSRREDAEDAVQQVFASLVRSRRLLTRVNDLAAYLFTSLRRAARKAAVQTARQPVAAGDFVAATTTAPEPMSSDSPHAEQLQQCLSALPAAQREVIALKLNGQLTFGQIGEVLAVSPNTAASRYRLALEKLRTALEVQVR